MKLLLPLIIIVVIVGGYFGLQKFSKKQPPLSQEPSSSLAPSPANLKTFESKTMKIKIEVPEEFNVEEKFASVKIKTSQGEISVDRNGTNFSNLNDYIKNSQNNLEVRITNRKELTINNLISISGMLEKEEIYFIYINNFVYTLSTSSPDLYDDLDQIAQSFRYIP